ncbi:hypothetical protein LCGC14_1687510 [marine sediment metagenome]|uniref:Uncharacterized protein n=1 Tax=marine sediment metagenome TaxID=412755 RepID=A0A0F9KLV9_9ZZZZ
MLSQIITKVRALIADLVSSDFQIFTYTTSSIFTLAQSNIGSITKVEQNGATLDSGDYSWDSTTNKLTITASLTVGDIIVITFTYYKFSDTEIQANIRSSLVYMSVYSYSADEDYEMETNDIYPTPGNKDTDVMALIASIIIKPIWTEYRTPTILVRYNRNSDKDEIIKKIIFQAKWAVGSLKIITID